MSLLAPAPTLAGMTRVLRTAVLLTTLVLLGGGLTGCGGKPAVCNDADALRTAVQQLKDARIGQNGLTVVQTQLAAIRTQLGKLKTDASQQYASQLSAVETAASSLRQDVATAVSSPSAASLGAVATDVQALGSSAKALADSVSGTC